MNPIAHRALPSESNASGRTFDQAEMQNLAQVIASGKLNCTGGTWVENFQSAFKTLYGVPFARCVTSGTAAIHTAIAAINPEPGDEIITTPITDMGALTPILYQTAIPIFADVDPHTYNITANSIEKKITARTKAIIVTHLFGQPCDMDPILHLAKRYHLPVIEDTAQALLAEYHGRRVGTLGQLGCFSLQQGKHITTGEGGIVISSDLQYVRRATLFVDKAWAYGDSDPDHDFLALNYRMTELQGAVACAQLEKLEEVVAARICNANKLSPMLSGIAGVTPPFCIPNAQHVYWKYCLDIDPEILLGGVEAFSRRLKEAFGIYSAPRYIKKPAFLCRIFREQNTFGASGFPFRGPHRAGLPPIHYNSKDYPGTQRALERICVLPWNEKYTEEDIIYIAEAIRNTAQELKK